MHHATLTTFQFPALISVSVFRFPFSIFLCFGNSIWKLLKQSFLIALAAASQGGPFFVWQLQLVNNNHREGDDEKMALTLLRHRLQLPRASAPLLPSTAFFSHSSTSHALTHQPSAWDVCLSVCQHSCLSVSQSDCLPRAFYISENSQQIALSAWKKCRWLINK